MPHISVRFPDELYDDLEAEVEQSVVIEDKSQLIRTAVRAFLQEEGEFEPAR